ncbi:MAG: SPOR domain-containing protein [Candidatus Latescibacteria bacterium]|nr:SPOR domain-containing protein [Candidatus Latescibacterota bacterium]
MKISTLFLFLTVIFNLACFRICEADTEASVPKEILRLIDEGKFDKAREKLQEFRRKAPGNPHAIFYLAQLEQDSSNALALYKEVEVLADSSLSAEAILARGELYFVKGDIATAEDLYNVVVSNYSSTPSVKEALFRLGIIKLISGVPEHAKVHFDVCIENNPDPNLRLLVETGIMECHVMLEEWDKVLESARTVLQETSDDNPVTPRVLEVIALAWHEMGNEENAKYYTERLLKNFPESYHAHVVRAQVDNLTEDSVLSGEADNSADDTIILSNEDDHTDSLSSDSDVESDSSTSDFTVQASAFRDKNNALKLFNQLKNNGLDARITMKTFVANHYYLVQVGSFSTRSEAERAAESVSGITGIKAIVISLDN